MSHREDLKRALSVSPDNLPLLLLYAEACLSDLLSDEARQAFERILALDPDNMAARLGIARVLFFTGRSSEAAVRLEALLAKEPGNYRALQLFARVLLGEGNRNQAAEVYQRSLDCDGATADAELERELGDTLPGDTQKVALTPRGLAMDGDDDEPDSEAMVDLERPKLGFADVGGMEPVKEEFRMKVLYPLRNPDLFRAYGKKVGGGVLLYGPPGCGKTLLSRACAGEMEATFLAIGIHQILDMWLGRSEKMLHETFELARHHSPCILFFDEVDALAADRVNLRHTAGRTLINQFLAELDGGDEGNEGVLVLAATNAPWHLDPAFLRPGRFDRVLFVPPPDETARAAIVEILAKGRPVAGLDAQAVARKTREFSGADLKNVFDLATERCLASAMRENKVVPLTTAVLVKTASEVRPTTKTWFETARNYALYANQTGFYDEVLTYLGLKK
jgi:ATP-dependent 26S proteasome regulatory subunit